MVSYYDIRAAQNAARALHNKLLRGTKLDIRYSIPKVWFPVLMKDIVFAMWTVLVTYVDLYLSYNFLGTRKFLQEKTPVKEPCWLLILIRLFQMKNSIEWSNRMEKSKRLIYWDSPFSYSSEVDSNDVSVVCRFVEPCTITHRYT